MQGSTKIPITELNAYITCKICNGYFVDASTIIECLHTFCRGCIIKYLQKNKYCPVCDVQVHKSKPLLNIRPDKTLQDIVYKLVPRLFQNEMQRRRQFYESHPEAKPSSLEQCGEVAYQYLLTPEETICLTLSYHGADNKPRYLRCPAAVTMGHLKKLIRSKYDLSENHRVDILYNQDCLSSSLTLIDIAYIYLWKRKGPIELTYRIYENTAKKLKLEHPENVDKSETNNLNNNNISNNNNWKEVQLRISENGEMSITGIQDSLSPGLLEIVNSEPKYKNEITIGDPKVIGKQVPKKELPGLKYIGKVNTPCTLPPTISDPLPIDNLNNLTASIGNFGNTIGTMVPTFTVPTVNDHLSVSLSSPSSSCATLSSGSTTTVFSTINSTKCSTKTEDSLVNVEKHEENKERGADNKVLKRKIEHNNTEIEPPAKQSKPIILNHNIGLLNLSNNHPLKKHSKMNRNGENVRDFHNAKIISDSEIKSTESLTTTSLINSSKPNNDIEGLKSKKMEIDASKAKNFAHGRVGTSTATSSKPLAMRAKTLISEAGVKPPCYQPRTVYNPLINVPRPLSTLNSATSVSLSSKIETRIPPVSSTRATTSQKSDKPTLITPTTSVSSQPILNSTLKTIIPQTQFNHTITKPTPTSICLNIPNKSQSSSPTSSTQLVLVTSTNKTPNISPAQQAQSNLSGSKVPSTAPSQTTPNSVQGNKLQTTSPPQQPQSTQSASTKTTTSTTSPQSSQNAVTKTSNSTIKAKPSTPIGYKTLRDPPKSWNSQISKANVSKSSPDPKYPDLKNVRPAKFFKMRNNIPRYLGNPASGVKPMYQVHVSPEKEKPSEMKQEKTEIKKHSIVKIDPKTLKPVSEKAPETTSLSNHSTILQTPNLNAHILTTQMAQIYPNPSQCLTTAVTTMNSGALNIQNDLKINTSSVSITNPLKLQSSSPKERKSPKSPHSPKMKTNSSPTGNKRDNKIARNFTPPNPFVPNIPTKPSLSPNQFIYPAMPPGFPTYDPRLMAAYYNQWYSQRMPFPPAALSGLNLDLNQRKTLEILASPGSPNMDALTQSMLNHQLPSRPTQPTSSNISPLQRSHNIPLSPTITKPPPASKKPPKEVKNDKSLETVVEKMTQNRIKTTNKPQNEVSKRAPEINKMESQSLPKILTNDSDSIKKNVDQKSELNKITEKIDIGTNQLLKIAKINTDKNVQQNSDKVEKKVEQKLEESSAPSKTASSYTKTSELTETKSEKAPEPPEKENSNTQNTIQSKEKLDKKSEVISTEENAVEAKTQVEVKEKE